MVVNYSDALLDHTSYNYDLLFAITDNAADGIVVADENGKILLTNKAACVIFAYFPTQMIGNDVTMLMPDDLRGQHAGFVKHYLEKKGRSKIMGQGARTVMGVRSDGATMPLELSIAATTLEEEDQTIFIALFRDITERLKSEEKMRRQAHIIEQIKDGVIVADVGQRILSCNTVLCEFVGLPKERIIRRRIHDLVRQELPGKKTTDEVQQEAIDKGMWNGLVQIKNAKEEGLWLDVSMTPQFDDNGDVNAFVSVWRNVTARREAEVMAARSERVESLGRVAGGVAHDINNLLFPLFLSLDEAMMDLQDLEQTEKVKNILDRTFDALSVGINIKDVVQNIMVFSHDGSTEISDLDTFQLFNDIWRLAKLCIPSSITVETNFTPDKSVLRATSTAISQVVVNLISNAVDAVDAVKGNISISTEIVEGAKRQQPLLFSIDEDKGYLMLTISDNGIGIPSDVLDKIFDPFFTTKDVGEGSGIGMSQVSQIIKGLDGALDVRSSEGEGTTFDVYLPLLLPSEH